MRVEGRGATQVRRQVCLGPRVRYALPAQRSRASSPTDPPPNSSCRLPLTTAARAGAPWRCCCACPDMPVFLPVPGPGASPAVGVGAGARAAACELSLRAPAAGMAADVSAAATAIVLKAEAAVRGPGMWGAAVDACRGLAGFRTGQCRVGRANRSDHAITVEWPTVSRLTVGRGCDGGRCRCSAAAAAVLQKRPFLARPPGVPCASQLAPFRP